MCRTIGANQRVTNWLRKVYQISYAKPAGQLAAVKLLLISCQKYLVADYAIGSDLQIALDKIVHVMFHQDSIEEVQLYNPVVFSHMFLQP